MIIFLYGPDDFRARRKIIELKAKFVTEVDSEGLSVSYLDGQTATLEVFNEIITPKSLFSDKRLVVIDNLLRNKNKEFITEAADFFIEEKDSENILVVYEESFIEKKTGGKVSIMKPGAGDRLSPLNKAEKKLFDSLSKGPFVQPFMKLSGSDLTKYLAVLAKEQKVSLTVPAANLLVRFLGDDLWLLSNELSKLSAYVLAQYNKKEEQGEKQATEKNPSSPIISEAEVKEQTGKTSSESIFSLTDALANRQNSLALEFLNQQFKAGVHPQYLVTMMLWQFKTLAMVREALDNGVSQTELKKALKLHPYVIEKSINQVRRFSLAAIKKVINELLELDLKNKTGQGELNVLLPVAVAKF